MVEKHLQERVAIRRIAEKDNRLRAQIFSVATWRKGDKWVSNFGLSHHGNQMQRVGIGEAN